MNAVFRAFRGECALLLRSRGALSMFVVGILFYSILYPIPYARQTPQKLPFVAVDQDGGACSRTLLRSLAATEGVSLSRGGDARAAMAQLRAGAVAGLLVIPRDFERGLLTGRAQSIPLYCDAAHLLVYRTVLQSVRQAVESLGAGVRVVRLEKRGVPEAAALQLQARGRPDVRIMYNPAAGYGSSSVPPVFVLILQQVLLAGCSMLEIRRRALGVEEEGGAGLLGRLLVPAALSVLFALYYFRVLAVLDDLTPTVPFGDVLVFLMPFFLACAALGSLLGRFFDGESQVMPVILPLSLPMLFLSGFVWPPDAMPSCLRLAAQVLPDTPAIAGLQLMTMRGASLGEVRLLWLQLWALAALFFALSRLAAALLERRRSA